MTPRLKMFLPDARAAVFIQNAIVKFSVVKFKLVSLPRTTLSSVPLKYIPCPTLPMAGEVDCDILVSVPVLVPAGDLSAVVPAVALVQFVSWPSKVQWPTRPLVSIPACEELILTEVNPAVFSLTEVKPVLLMVIAALDW